MWTGSRTAVRGLLLKDRRESSTIFKGRKTNSAEAETFDILVKIKLGASHRFYVLDEVQDSSLTCICVEKGDGQFEESREVWAVV